ncbi:MAG: dihydrolipoyl dehydrogenase [Sporomusaceae bacterium]|nr:dihydrolipoyl dehydrogenase [Sporomusaceae bacterium]
MKRIIVIGGGPGGYVAAIRAAQLGAEVHLVENEHIGGTCLNVGCIPTKSLLHAAELYHAVTHGASQGIKADNVTVDWPAVMARKRAVVTKLVRGVEGLLKANGVTVHRGAGSLKGPRTVEIVGDTPAVLEADAVILATGSEPVRLNFPGADLPGVIDSTAALALPAIPASIAIIGGGVIGVEFAALYRSFGAEVTVIEMLPEILPPVDGEIAALIRGHLAKQGVKFLTGARLSEVKKTAAGLAAVVVAGDKTQEIAAEQVLVAVGRRPRTAGLGLENAGIATERGRVTVDANFLTNQSGVYAVGDINGLIMLAHAASAQGTAAVEHALGHRSAYHGHTIPSCIYTSPEVAGVGLTEEQAKAQGVAYKTGVFPLAGNGKALIESGGTGQIKIISGAKHGEILGVHIFGPRATDLIAEAALALRLEATVDELISTIHAHPTVSEAMGEAALAVAGAAIHWPPARKS